MLLIWRRHEFMYVKAKTIEVRMLEEEKENLVLCDFD